MKAMVRSYALAGRDPLAPAPVAVGPGTLGLVGFRWSEKRGLWHVIVSGVAQGEQRLLQIGWNDDPATDGVFPGL